MKVMHSGSIDNPCLRSIEGIKRFYKIEILNLK